MNPLRMHPDNQSHAVCACMLSPLHGVTAQVGEDPRPVLRAAYAAFQEGREPERILAAADPMRGSRDTFYAKLVRRRSVHATRKSCTKCYTPCRTAATARMQGSLHCSQAVSRV